MDANPLAFTPAAEREQPSGWAGEMSSVEVEGLAGTAKKPEAVDCKSRWCTDPCTGKRIALIATVVVFVIGLTILIVVLTKPTDPDPLPPACAAPADCVQMSHARWTSVLAAHVRPATSASGTNYLGLDYEAVRADPEFRAYLAELEAAPIPQMDSQGRKALFINAYNALAVRLLLDECGGALCGSIRDIGSMIAPVWGEPAGQIGGGGSGSTYSLDNIEHGYLRATFSDARMHSGVNCASVSCPDLAMEAFEAATLDAQLDASSAAWLANPTKGLSLAAGTLTLSKIFDWYNDDFVSWAGGELGFVGSHGPSAVQTSIAGLAPSIAYFGYDWNVNTVN